MNDKDLHRLFNELEGQFDIEIPNSGHKSRFEKKLKSLELRKSNDTITLKKLMLPLTAIAAVLLLFFSLNIFESNTGKVNDLADVSTEMAKTQDYFTLAINSELSKIEGKRSPETQKLIDDAMKQLSILEKDYESLKKDLQISGDDERVIFAMISNFQTRVNLLKNVLEHINQIPNYKNDRNENTSTI